MNFPFRREEVDATHPRRDTPSVRDLRDSRLPRDRRGGTCSFGAPCAPAPATLQSADALPVLGPERLTGRLLLRRWRGQTLPITR